MCVCVCQNSKAVVVEVEFDKWMQTRYEVEHDQYL